MKKMDRKFIIALSAIVLIGICVVTAILLYFPKRVRAVYSRPLVLIHNPVNSDQIEVGEGISVHATARNQKGITHMELWVDGELVHAKEAPEGETNPLVLTGNWQPTTIGKHVLLVRAFSADEIDGQSTITIEALEAELFLEEYIVEDGDTLESIAEEHGISEDELSELNPEMPSGGPVPGDSLGVPSGGGSGPGEPAEPEELGESPPADEPSTDDAPTPDDGAPGDFLEVLYAFGFNFIEYNDLEASEPRMLLVEILSFETNTIYEDTNCYISLGESPWDVAELAGASNFIVWPGDQDLPFDIACEGIAAGGTDSVELGRLALQIPSDQWDGITRAVDSLGGEGAFSIEYRVTQTEPRYLDLDPDMTPPTRLILDGFRSALRWEHLPRPDEDIRGFAIFLNDTEQWTEPADARLSELPPEWLRPPCGEEYVFDVRAFGEGYPESGAWSYFANPNVSVATPPDECEAEVLVTFHELITHDLPGDGDARHRTDGDIGPAYGHFYSNEQRAEFDMGSLEDNLGHIGLFHNTTYDLSTFSDFDYRSWIGKPTFINEVPEGEILWLGFHIDDEDNGDCDDSDDPGCDDLICEGERIYSHSYDELYMAHEGSIISEDGRCEVTFTVEPTGDAPIGSPGGWTPAPWLAIQEVSVDEASSTISIEIKNLGTATWPYRDLQIASADRSGEILSRYWEREFALEPGDTTLIERPYEGDRPMEICWVLDPENEVPESVELNGAFPPFRPYCPPLPDLIISDVRYSDSRLLVTVQNIGDGEVENRIIDL